MKNLLLPLLLAGLPFATLTAKNPVEVGDVEWMRSYPAAVAEANKANKPLLILFQEVPG